MNQTLVALLQRAVDRGLPPWIEFVGLCVLWLLWLIR
jgi:hypothetical protein